MKVSSTSLLTSRHTQHDIVTETENFFIKLGDSWGLVHNSPAINIGVNPENGKFFVATKSLFNKTPKINYTEDDIRNNHSGGLTKILPLVLKHGKSLGIKSGIFQGDLMFTPDIKKKETIDGEPHWTFQPNTIKYAVPVNSELGKTIGKAKIGILFHTQYTGDSIDNLSANFRINLDAYMKKTKDVWWSDTYFKDVSGTANFTASESKELQKDMVNLKQVGRGLKSIMNRVSKNADMVSAMSQYINSKVRAGNISINTSELLDFVQTTLKTSEVKRESISKFIHDHKYDIDELFQFHRQIAGVKLKVVRKLESVQNMKHFLQKGDDLVVTAPEGFVALDRDGNALKLVDRLSFSRANFCKN